MTIIRTAGLLPMPNAELRQALYSGGIFHLPRTAAAERLVAAVLAMLGEELGEGGPIREAQFRLSGEEFFTRIGRLRKAFFTEPRFHEAARALFAAYGFDPAELAFDPVRLRVVAHRGFEDPRAAPVYYAHRDTWYAHPQSQITWWIALHDVTQEETFEFYPERFARPVDNSSGVFDYDDWVREGWGLKIGWQDRDAGRTATYPSPIGEVDPGPPISFSCQAGEVVLFSGAQFHKTRKNLTGRTRFSLDFRTVHLGDHAQGIGAPNVDNRSRGSALPDYVQPEVR